MILERGMNSLTFSAHVEGNRTVLLVTGEVDVETAPALRECIAGLDNQGVQTLVLDMAGVVFCDSSGLGVLIEAKRRLRSHGGSLTLTHVRDAVRLVFEVTGLTDALNIKSDLKPAA